jgi:hypothetical protein
VGDDGRVLPTSVAPADNAEIQSAVLTFMAAWLARTASATEWHDALAPLATPSLAASLVGVDPMGVPATRVVGHVVVTLRSDLYAQVTVPVDTGSVVLGLLNQDGRWLVDTLDWDRP